MSTSYREYPPFFLKKKWNVRREIKILVRIIQLWKMNVCVWELVAMIVIYNFPWICKKKNFMNEKKYFFSFGTRYLFPILIYNLVQYNYWSWQFVAYLYIFFFLYILYTGFWLWQFVAYFISSICFGRHVLVVDWSLSSVQIKQLVYDSTIYLTYKKNHWNTIVR